MEARWLIDNGVVNYDNYKKLCSRSSLKILRRGCRSNSALVDYDTMPARLRVKVDEVLGGSPEKLMRERGLLRECLEYREANCKDMDAWAYFSGLRAADGGLLAEEKVRRMVNGAKIMEAISDAVEKLATYNKMCHRRLSLSKEFEKFAEQLQFDIPDKENNLPVTGAKLYEKWKKYKAFGYEVLVHGLTGRDSNRAAGKRKEAEEIEAVISELVAYGGKLSDKNVARVAKALNIDIDRRRVGEIRKKNEVINMAGREGEKIAANKIMMQVERVRPSQPMLMWCSDGWDAELYYRNEKSYYNRLTIVVVVDTFNDYPMGYAIGERECSELIAAAYRDAVHHAEALYGEALMPYQIQSDNYAKTTMPQYYKAICRHYTPARVGNAKSKVVEQFFRTLQSDLELLPNYSGHNITAKKQVNSEWLGENVKAFPDKAGCIAQLERPIALARGRRKEALMASWIERDETKVLRLDREKYLMQFGEVSRGNMLTPNGVKLIREGVEYKYDCFDIKMREMRGERWKIHYDRDDMRQVVAESEDGRFRFEMCQKKRVPMALADFTEEDEGVLAMYRQFNEGLTHYIGSERAKRQELAQGFVSKQQLEGELAAKLLTDKKGQHKDRKYEERKRLSEAAGRMAEEAEYDEVQQEKKKRQREVEVEDIYSRM